MTQSLRIPAFLYGRYRDVARAVRKRVTRLRRGATLDALTDEWLDVDAHQGLLALDGPSPMLGREPQFHCFALNRAIVDAQLTLEPRYVDQALSSAWGLLGLFEQLGLHEDIDLLPFLDRAVELWPVLDGVGPRYSRGMDLGAPLWSLPTKLKFALARQGVDHDNLRRPLGDGGLAALVSASPGFRIRALLRRGDVAAAEAIATASASEVLSHLASHFAEAGHLDRAVALVAGRAERDPIPPLVQWLSNHRADTGTATVEDEYAAYLASPSRKTWQRLRAIADDATCERARRALADRGEHVHVVDSFVTDGDGDGALAALDRARAAGVANVCHESAIAGLIAAAQPDRAVELFARDADGYVAVSRRSWYRLAVGALTRACAALESAGHPDHARALVDQFRARHRRRRALIEVLDAEGPAI